VLRVGLTGGIGAGKSAVARALAEHGAVVIDADQLARAVVEPGTPGLARVVEEFGEDVLRPDGSLDRDRLGAIVFSDPERRQRLNAIVHPLVGERTAALLESAPPDAVVVQDIPLLVENGLAPQFALVIVVEAPMEVRLRRLIHDRGMTPDHARARLAAQATDEQRRAVADVVLVNDGTLAELAAKVDELWHNHVAPLAAVARRADTSENCRGLDVPWNA
jgi:dephospho-CoA kinase